MSQLFINIAMLFGTPLMLACGLIQFALWFTDRAQRAYLYWGSVNLIGVAGVSLYLVRGSVPWLLSVLLPNIIVIATGLLLWAGLRRFAGRPVRGRASAAALGAFAIAYAALALVFEGIMPRIILVSVVLMVMNFGMARDLWSQQRDQYLIVRNLLILAMLLHGLYYLYRTGHAAYVGPASDLLHTAATVDALIVIGMIKTTVWNLAVVLMVREARGVLGFGPSVRTRHPGA